ncbi:hypothetical protein LBMAG53_39710 [Planctomycetota bacterium]|nr:hypothetical protein LBMAG53_39710 [Planctomycetota bacterium]
MALVLGIGEQAELGTDWVGEHRLGDEALALPDQFRPHRIRGGRRLPGIKIQLARKNIGIDEAQAGGGEIGVEVRAPARAIGTCDNQQQWAPRQQRRDVFTQHQASVAGVKIRFTKRPAVRVPSSVVRTRMPARSGWGS